MGQIGRPSGWMITSTGRAFYPLQPRVQDLHSIDIAHSLSMQCRYGGHTKRFYSVAEHCVLMSYAVPAQDAAWALLHDATEAYVSDVISPIKRELPQFREIEEQVMECIVDKYKLGTYAMPASVVAADLRILLDERAELLPPSRMRWRDEIENLTPLGVPIEGWSPELAEDRYLARMVELDLLVIGRDM